MFSAGRSKHTSQDGDGLLSAGRSKHTNQDGDGLLSAERSKCTSQDASGLFSAGRSNHTNQDADGLLLAEMHIRINFCLANLIFMFGVRSWHVGFDKFEQTASAI